MVPGGTVTERWVPVDRVGLYVPGGLAVYPSSVVMNVVPAQVAGRPLARGGQPAAEGHGGLPDPAILAACALLGVDEVYAVGGAQAIAMFGYGAATEERRCEPVDLVTGPGNVYVTAAKRLLRGVVGIDAEAGPTEIAILADDTADPVHVAADLISQAEHDPLGGQRAGHRRRVALADAVEAELARQVAGDQARRAGHRGADRRRSRGVVLVDDLDAGPAGGRRVRAPSTWRSRPADAPRVGARVRNAGAIFVGAVLAGRRSATTAPAPTTCCPPAAAPGTPAGLSVQSFLRGVHLVEYDEDALREVADHVVTLADAEDLPAHGAGGQRAVRGGPVSDHRSTTCRCATTCAG